MMTITFDDFSRNPNTLSEEELLELCTDIGLNIIHSNKPGEEGTEPPEEAKQLEAMLAFASGKFGEAFTQAHDKKMREAKNLDTWTGEQFAPIHRIPPPNITAEQIKEMARDQEKDGRL